MTGSSNLKPCRKRMKVKPIPEKTALPPGSMIGEMLAMQQISLSSFASALEITETDAEALLAACRSRKKSRESLRRFSTSQPTSGSALKRATARISKNKDGVRD